MHRRLLGLLETQRDYLLISIERLERTPEKPLAGQLPLDELQHQYIEQHQEYIDGLTSNLAAIRHQLPL
jgi:hypothetical protein